MNGEVNGKVKEYFEDKLTFEGDYKNDKRNGYGKEYDKDGNLIFEGEYLNGQRWNGKGKELLNMNKRIEFEGEYLNDKRWNGKIKEYDDKGNLFEGEYLNGKRNGYGKKYDKYND